MKEIPLKNGLSALVDDEDFDLCSRYKWSPSYTKNGDVVYAVAYIPGKKMISMHRLLLNPGSSHVDHIDRNGLNNQKYNLRLCDNSKNHMNCKVRSDSRSGYKGVRFRIKGGRYVWRARIVLHKKKIELGTFHSDIEAAKAYDAAAVELFGEYARLNFPNELCRIEQGRE